MEGATTQVARRRGALVSYTQNDLDQIEAMVVEGLSAAKIAAILGRSRNSVISAIHRHLNKKGVALQGRLFPAKAVNEGKPRTTTKNGAGIASKARTARKLALNPKPSAPLPEAAVVPDELFGPGLPLWMLSERQCRWAVNEAARGEVHLFCGAWTPPVETEKVMRLSAHYCACHAARAVTKPATSIERRAAAVKAKEHGRKILEAA